VTSVRTNAKSLTLLAWLLWGESYWIGATGTTSDLAGWHLITKALTQAECEQERVRAVAEYESRRAERFERELRDHRGARATRFACLPDTVDPRVTGKP
jgi:hypothetical protein